jgi:hypothetical protein
MSERSDKKWQRAAVIGTWVGAILRAVQILIHER